MKNSTGKRINIITVVLACALIIMVGIPLNAANYITVATIGDKVPTLDKSHGMQNVVDQVEKFWH